MAIQPGGNVTSAAPGMREIQQRYIASLFPVRQPGQIKKLQSLAAEYASTLQSDGEWADIPYANQERATWKAAEHLERTLVMAKSARYLLNQGKDDPVLDRKVITALTAWTTHDYQNSNWWWNQIGVPQLTGEIATLMYPELSGQEVAKVAAIMTRSEWRKGRWTGANLIWGVENEIIRGCLEGSTATVREGYDRMYQEAKIVSPTQEGIQQDFSFHQHGPQLYSGGYGLTYADDLGRFIAFAWGTQFQIPANRMEIFSDYILNGIQWMVRGDIIDYSVIGRVITRAGETVAPQDWTMGPISPAGPAYSLENVIDLLAAQPIPRRKEFEEFAARLHGRKGAPHFTGNKQFWCSDFMAHRRAGFYTSVKMLSNRTLAGESVNNEGKKSEHLSDGVNLLYMSGNEYKDIFPVWDWTKLPGTTAIQGTLDIGGKNPTGARGRTAFAGGVSDGVYGMAAMDLARGNLTASKAWFFFDRSYICLGAGITLTADTEHSVVTDVNQTLLLGKVIVNNALESAGTASREFAAHRPMWVYHDHVGYVFAAGSHFDLFSGPQSGRWSDIGTGSDQLVTRNVFNLWLDHGAAPHAAGYQYVVLPGATVQETAYLARHPDSEILANTAATQAVWNNRLKIGMAAFREPGSVATPAGELKVDHTCLVMIRKSADGWKITAASPENLAFHLHISLGSYNATIELPHGNLAGSSVSALISNQQRP